ncbi:MAG TPA: hypothetical protein VFW39_01900 [Sphingomicrobium sp.]|nr:hypothetical protein [Sphingomicrobium sp.]
MHFHLPKPLHGWRAFAGEVGIIVLGVLIALGFGALVDEWQWRGKIRRAEDAMRIELSKDDGPQAYARALIGGCLDAQISRIHDGAETASPEQLRQWTAAYGPPFRVWDSEAWNIVVASDIGSHMGSDRAIAWSKPYRIVPMLTAQNADEARLVIDMRNALPLSGPPSPSDLQNLRRTSGQLRVINRRFVTSAQLLLARIGANGAQVPVAIRRELISDARAMYGGCVTVPDLNAPVSADSVAANLKSPSLSE